MVRNYFKNQNRTGKTILLLISFLIIIAIAQVFLVDRPRQPLRDYGTLYSLIVILALAHKFKKFKITTYLIYLIPNLTIWYFFYVNALVGDSVIPMLFGMVFMLPLSSYLFSQLSPVVLMAINSFVILNFGYGIQDLPLIVLILWFLTLLVVAVSYSLEQQTQLIQYKNDLNLSDGRNKDLLELNRKLNYILNFLFKNRGALTGYISSIKPFKDNLLNVKIVSDKDKFRAEATIAQMEGLTVNNPVIAFGKWKTFFDDKNRTNQVYLKVHEIKKIEFQSHQADSGEGLLFVSKLLINSSTDVSLK